MKRPCRVRDMGLSFRRNHLLSGPIIANALAWGWLAGLALWISSYYGRTTTIVVSGDGTVTATFIELPPFIKSSGLLVPMIFLAPVLLTGLALLEVWFRGYGSWTRSFALLGLGVACLAWSGLALLFLGTVFLPVALALSIAVGFALFQTQRRGRPGKEIIRLGS